MRSRFVGMERIRPRIFCPLPNAHLPTGRKVSLLPKHRAVGLRQVMKPSSTRDSSLEKSTCGTGEGREIQ